MCESRSRGVKGTLAVLMTETGADADLSCLILGLAIQPWKVFNENTLPLLCLFWTQTFKYLSLLVRF